MKLKTKNGKLTAYGFSCGYLEHTNGWTIYKDGIYHVQNATEWLSFATLAEARKATKTASA